MSTGEREPPGLQWERTRLSWDRTALSFAAFGALLLRFGRSGRLAVDLLIGGGTLGAGLAVYVLGRWRYRIGLSARDRDTASRRKALGIVTALVVTVAVLTGAQAVLSH